MLKSILAAVALSLAVAVPAVAQTALEVPANAGWKHAQTGLVLRSTLAGLPRTGITDSSTGELDVFVQYGDTDATAVTVYIFRPAAGGVPIWFERVEAQVLARDIFQNPTAQGAPLAFAPPSGTVTSALRRIYVPGKGPFKATGVAMMPLGEWLVAIRISSQQIDAPALDAKMSEIVAGLGWPENVSEGEAAAPIPACPTSLAYARNAKLNKPDMTDAIMGALIAGVAAEKAKESPEPREPTSWCREGEGSTRFGVYRAVDSTNAYMMALGDAGRVIHVHPGIALEKKARYQLSVGDLDRTLVYPTFDKLPRPETAFEAVMKNRPVSSSTRSGKEVTIGVGK
jgi:hypothetical protein